MLNYWLYAILHPAAENMCAVTQITTLLPSPKLHTIKSNKPACNPYHTSAYSIWPMMNRQTQREQTNVRVESVPPGTLTVNFLMFL